MGVNFECHREPFQDFQTARTAANGDVAHVRPSGNADELRIYAVADSQDRADAIAAMGTEEPAGILRRMEKAVES